MTGQNSRLHRLEVVRGKIEAALSGDVPVRDFAALSREYRAVLAEIDDLSPKEAAGDAVDEITARRNARRGRAAAVASRAEGEK